VKYRAFRAAIPYTLPVFMGYLFLGIAFGVLLTTQGFPVWLAPLMSLTIYAGSGQFVAIGLLSSVFSPVRAMIVTLAVNARHLFYGLSILDKVKSMGKRRAYMSFSLTDETYSLLCSVNAPPEVDQNWFLFFIALLDHSYWIFGSTLGAVAGATLGFNSTGIEFAMTALFIVIFVEQWENAKSHIPALLGLGVTTLCLLFAGSEQFILWAMAGIFLCLTALRGKLELKEKEGAAP